VSSTHESIGIETWPSDDGQQHVFVLRGSLDLATAPTVRAALLEAAQTDHELLIIDLTQLEFLDSTGLGALIGCSKRARETGGEVRMVVGEGQILRLLRITGLMNVFAVYPTLDAALVGAERINDREPLTGSARK
jgi:anti-sigma B factor antagonist